MGATARHGITAPASCSPHPFLASSPSRLPPGFCRLRFYGLTTTPAKTYNGSQAYGETYAAAGSADPSYTGHAPDTVGDLYDTWFRRYSSRQGRWLNPDPAGRGAVNPGDPQSWNRYAYVANNPLILLDPLGLICKHTNSASLRTRIHTVQAEP